MKKNDIAHLPLSTVRKPLWAKSLQLGLLLPSLLGVFLLTAPADAAKLQSWRFDANQNRLFFTTNGRVQPKAQMVYNPARLVIDLPGVTLGRPKMEQMVGRGIKSVRVGQFNSTTTRMVLELENGYTLDPQEVRFQGITPQQWVVEIPTPQRTNQASRPPVPLPLPTENTRAVTSLENIEVTPEEIIFRTSGRNPILDIKRAADGSSTTIDLRATTLSPDMENDFPSNVNGVKNISVRQLESSPPMVRVTLETETDTPNWRAQIVAGGAILKPDFGRGPVGVVPPVNPPVRPPEISNPPAPLPRPNNRIVIVVDPGHGGRDPGAVGWGGIQEKEIVLDISRQVASSLEQQGIQAILTRNDDREIDLAPRVQLAERLDATLFVSIHANAINMNRPDVNGLETYYYSSGLGLARSIHNSILQSVDIKNRGVRQAGFYVIKRTSMPAVLVEVGFVTGREDSQNLANPTHRAQLAQAISRGIVQYLQQR
ncbi:N-acetylmuramoyl-L-alanine amidase [Ancylothrix sp. C2]|uniref:N-acetylmuramoyl-L-alanine amidase n=1 Tax=Ancylothrix sp. D3o TaxID=2953691 RepID=UPI0021BA6EAC|nr:N-acetylmuramoyl-L-alanine amidase [Ancylothrix sp. D3o]MCT7949018.1 N-acetylmuramoyl-L-alanine amidase [Ancylothrix sp. D3o]